MNPRKRPLFGKSSFIYRTLLSRTFPKESSHYEWDIDVRDAIRTIEGAELSFVIDFKPTIKTELEFFELLHVWGLSESKHSYTPMLFRLRRILLKTDGKLAGTLPPSEIPIDESRDNDPVHTITYCQGGISEGQLMGGWNPPPRSPTNSAFLWPHHVRCFCDQLAAKKKFGTE